MSFEVRRYGPDAVARLRDEIVDVHADARAELLDQPFYSRERFAERLDGYASDPRFDLVGGYVGGVLVGFAFGSPLPERTRWWAGMVGDPDPELIRETGTRTFAFREIVVRSAYQRRGYAHRLHDQLLADRPEQRATLLVRRDNPARDLYLRWGWRVVGQVQPFADSPVFDAMLRSLPAR